MPELIIAVAAFSTSLLTLFTGFGLGTLLLPVFTLFFPVQIAVASTAIVHGANNVFKAGLLFRSVDWNVIIRFGIPAILAALAGALFLSFLTAQPEIYSWEPLGRSATITPLKLVMAILILMFAFLEFNPRLISLPPHSGWLTLGGVLAGFFGGLSGHQGALRAAFLGPLGLPPNRFVATQAFLGFLVDSARIPVYAVTFLSLSTSETTQLPATPIMIAVISAFAGAFLGKRLLPSVTRSGVRKITGILLIIVGIALGLGLT